jgi:hypothetical protein
MLREVNPDWHITWFEVHGPEIIPNLPEHRARIQTADLVISQPIHQGYRGKDELSLDWIRANVRPAAMLLVVPSMHFSAHHPGLDGLPLPGLSFLSNLLAAHLVASGYAPDRAVQQLLSDDLFQETDIDAEIRFCIDEAVRREKDDGIDIRISPFLEANGHSRMLFHIQNHPTRETTAFIVNQILAMIDQTGRVSIEGRDYQYDTHVPALPSIARYLRKHGQGAPDDPANEMVRLPGSHPMTQAEYYTAMTQHLAACSPDEVFDAIQNRWPTVQVLRRLAKQEAPIPGIARWLQH